MIDSLFRLIDLSVQFYIYAVFVYIVLSMLFNSGVLSGTQKILREVYRFLEQIVEPPLAFIRQYLPAFGGIDFSPLILILGLQLLKSFF